MGSTCSAPIRVLVKAGVKLVALFSPEHGIRGYRRQVECVRFERCESGVPIYSLYGTTTLAPPDSVLKNIDVLVIDLQDVGTRTWTYVGAMVYAIRATGRREHSGVGTRPTESDYWHAHRRRDARQRACQYERKHAAKPANGFALASMPLRHGLTMGELALYYEATLKAEHQLHVIPMRNWRRFDVV